MSIKTAIQSRVMASLTGEAGETRRRAKAEHNRRRRGAPHVVEYFHQVDDPYSHLAAQALALLASRYDVEIRAWLVGPPADWAAPERDRLIAYARLDAGRLAARAGLSFRDPGLQPSADAVTAAEAALAQAIETGDFLATAPLVGETLWAGRTARTGEGPMRAAAARSRGEARRQALGHFMSGMIHYGGEWYWGLDRLHYLEARLAGLGLRRQDAPTEPVFAMPALSAAPVADRSGPRQVLHYYLSFRSPYTYIAAERAKALADAYGAELRLRFVLPMIMRGLPVPMMKALYFTRDTAREARRVGVPFGRIADPVGRPVERGYALLPWAIAQGRGYAYCLAFMRAVWSEGVDAGSDAGLRRIVTAAGLDWSQAAPLIGDEAWRAEAEANRQEMMALGLWGVPCFRVGDTTTWGQDRLWVIEDALRRGEGVEPAGA